MRRVAYDTSWDDEEWRDVNFSESEILAASNTGIRQPTYKELIKAAEKYGTDGILESAIMLRQFEYKKVAEAVVKLTARRK